MNYRKLLTIVLAADDNYAQHLAVVAASVLINATKPSNILIYVLSDSISLENKKRIEQTIVGLSGNVVFIPFVSNSIQGFVSGHLSTAAYLRLLIPQLLPQDVKKTIYLDTDLIVLTDIQELWDINLEGKPVGAIPDYGIMASSRMRKQKRETLGMLESQPYFNSGVMVMDVQQWREHQYGSQCIASIKRNQFRHHDQDGLNKVFLDNWKVLPLRWNVIPPVFSLAMKVVLNKYYRKEAIAAKRNPAIMHWAGRYKPWEFPLQGVFNSLYYHYLHKTAFCDIPMPKPSKDMTGKSLKRQLYRMKWANFLAKYL